MFPKFKIALLFFLITAFNCPLKQETTKQNAEVIEPEEIKPETIPDILPGAFRTGAYFDFIKEKKVALLVNQTSMIGERHLADSLQNAGIDIVKIFAPEHGFRGEADAGESIKDGSDQRSGIPIVSLYGNKKKPSAKDLEGIEIIIFDIQDVGARFYTYISVMTYVMESCAENDVEFMVLDRPNPNGHYVDGPVLKDEISYIGLHPVPVVHGMTIGEYASMVNGEGWLQNGLQCKLKVIECSNYDHNKFYELPVKPSPNLPNMRAIYLYPSLCFFEGTTVSEGRGTGQQFQVYGHPKFKGGNLSFTPKPMPGAKSPKHEGVICHGFDLSNVPLKELREERELNLSYLLDFYKTFPEGETFFLENNFFDKLAGSKMLRKQILDGMDEVLIRESWQEDLEKFNQMRKKYLLYKDFD